MPWQGFLGHDEIVEGFRRCVERNRLGQAFLFVGPEGIGKRQFAVHLAQALLCSSDATGRLEPCGTCADCRWVEAGTHPDLILVSRPDDKHELPVELIIGRRERRHQEGLCHELSLKPSQGRRKVAVIDDADLLNAESANSLLKTLEEPPPHAVLILVGTGADRQLPTIRSRCQIVRFHPLCEEDVARILEIKGYAKGPSEARRLAALSGGSVGRAVELAEPELGDFRKQLFQRLSDPRFDTVELAREVNAFVEAVGKENAARRARARQLVGFCTEFYHGVLWLLCGVEPRASGEDESAACRRFRDHLLSTSNEVDAIDTVTAMADRSLEANYHIDRRVHLALSLECLFDDLGKRLEPTMV